ncbi:D-alanyl-D-alanine carboxypeptidase [Bacillus sp. FJAT-29790]|uniref:D-alanyl-D-alanine carboxypeptidase family protein n=1 Tax=Bacillus sp. FJAT-29790 TaxID=1895002 RepID=UPI001C21DE0A|nr:D-alanyl-D-alanine carboxypeptidase family protein [Bacillus sp. FJAT-29790]MBU8878359.1 D-alanyl-D-alanine carboxypeptidase [Bacillus sp. FJAT-29790]
MKKMILLLVLVFCITTPLIKVADAEENSKPEISSETAILVDSKTGAILFQKNAQNKMYPASLTKIATAIYAIENGNLDDIVTISKEAAEVDGTSVFLEAGEEVTLKKLIQGMLINSGNDAAAAIAEHLDRSIDKYSEHINSYLTDRVQVKNTHFTNPHGLFNKDHYTTAEDLAIITNYALKNKTFREIYGTKALKWTGKSWDTTLLTHHLMLKGEIPYEEVNGGKTGYVQESQFTLATTAANESMELTAIVLKSNDSKEGYSDTKKLLDYGFDQFNRSLISKTDVFHADGKTFTTGGEDILITVPKSLFEKRMTNEGKLEYIDEKGEVVQTVQLAEKKKTDNFSHQVIEKEELKTSTGNYGKFTMVIFLLGGLIIGVRWKIQQ